MAPAQRTSMLYHDQPLKGFYLAGQAFAIPFFYAPYWFFTSIPYFFKPPPGEKSRAHAISRHIRISYLRQMMRIIMRTGLSSSVPDHTRITPPKLPGSYGVWVPPLADDLIVGDIRSHAEAFDVSSIQIPGYWIHKDHNLKAGEPPKPGEKVLYYTHGGGYVALTAHPDGPMAPVPRGFLEHCPSITRTFSTEYRLLCPGAKAAHPFPTALLDALAGYTYLVKLGFKEEDIVLCGDSAGGNLALALTRYLTDNRRKAANLPRAPGALVLFSPWVDMSESFEASPVASTTKAAAHDWASPVNDEEMKRAIKTFLGNKPDEIANAKRYIYSSPASPYLLGLTPDSTTRKISFKGYPRTWLDLGGSEVLHDQIKRLGVAMEEDLGKDKFVLNECPGGIHGYISFVWFEPERSKNMKKIAGWLDGV
ncbi:alpha/beta-hydrolase [Thelephora ganbajun]|uniref:Alpha/beta-hydrolase n=1 Tax=Thelephora ganbajun TaxID=370292 RepID=A0ACB6ZGG6_THEGA|nr:alpha/beta-hydrolase [Thelephora ganbajun]